MAGGDGRIVVAFYSSWVLSDVEDVRSVDGMGGPCLYHAVDGNSRMRPNCRMSHSSSHIPLSTKAQHPSIILLLLTRPPIRIRSTHSSLSSSACWKQSYQRSSRSTEVRAHICVTRSSAAQCTDRGLSICFTHSYGDRNVSTYQCTS